jgi:hypothetical protein
MNGLFTAALEAQQFFEENRWRFCIIGGLAVVHWGQPRSTQDVDISLLTGIGAEAEFVDRLLTRFPARIAEAKDFALESRVVLCTASNSVPLDIALAAFPLEERMIARASRCAFSPEVSLVTVSAEDLIVLKAFAGRDQDWADVRGILARQASSLSWEQILQELAALCEIKEDRVALDRLEEIRKETC